MKHRLKQGVALLVTGLAVGNFANRNEGDTPPVTTSPSQALGQAQAKVVRPLAKRQQDESAPEQAELSPLAAAIDRGQPLRLQLPGREPLDFSFRDYPLLADGYRTTLSQAGRLDANLRIYEGRAIDGDGRAHAATLALANRSVAGVVRLANGGQVRLRSADGEQFASLANPPGQAELVCVRDPRTGMYRTMSLGGGLARPDWSQAGSTSLEPSPEFPVMASSGKATRSALSERARSI